jgi:hypothetical protein
MVDQQAGAMLKLADMIDRRGSTVSSGARLLDRVETVARRYLDDVALGQREDKLGEMERAVEKEWRDRVRALRDPELSAQADSNADRLTTWLLLEALEAIKDRVV